MSLRQDRVLFFKLKAELYQWMLAELPTEFPGIEFAEDEGRIITPRLVKLPSGVKVMAEDRVHRTPSFHHRGLAVDLLIFINGDYLEDGGHPVWKRIDEKARSLHPKFGLGISFQDSNHLSLNESSGS